MDRKARNPQIHHIGTRRISVIKGVIGYAGWSSSRQHLATEVAGLCLGSGHFFPACLNLAHFWGAGTGRASPKSL
jgi:hypothetical protein